MTDPQTINAAILIARDLLIRAQALRSRLAHVRHTHNVVTLGERRIRDGVPAGPSERPAAERVPEGERSPEMRELMETLELLARELVPLRQEVAELTEATLPNSPYAPEAASAEQELDRLSIELMAIARSPAINPAYREEMNAAYPALWSEETVDRLAASIVGLTALIDNRLGRRDERPVEVSAIGPVAASELPFPATPEAIRRELSYSPERDGNPDNYLRTLASRLRTPANFDAFLAAMVKYDESFNAGGRQFILNLNRIDQNQLWHDPRVFLTTYDSDGRIVGDCKSVALAMRSVLRLQGRDAVAIESDVAQPPDAAGRITTRGHMETLWFDTVNGRLAVHRLDTTGRDGSAASVTTFEANPGETREQLIVRAFATNEGADPITLSAEHVGLCFLRRNGAAVNLPVTVGLLAQAQPLERAVETGDYDAALTSVRAEMARTPDLLNLRLCEVQLLLLKSASPADLEPIIASIEEGANRVASMRASPNNTYQARATGSALRAAGHAPLGQRLQAAVVR